MRFVLNVLPVLAVLLVAACGGGGGGGGDGGGLTGPTGDELSGTYFRRYWEARATGPSALSEWGTIAADGGGLVTGGTRTQNTLGNVFGPRETPPLAYLIDDDRRLAFYSATTRMGAIAADGRVAVLGVFSEGDVPGMEFLLRKAGSFDDSTLDGSYHICALVRYVAGVTSWWDGTVAFDGAGTVPAFATSFNREGNITHRVAPVPFGTYDVAPDGTVTWITGVTGLTLEGGVTQDGELAVFSGSSEADNRQALVILVREGTSLSTATFSGTYHEITIRSRTLPAPYEACSVARAIVDGAGTYSPGSGITNVGGFVSDLVAGIGAEYTVSTNGALSLSADLWQGAITQDGRFAVVAGGADTDRIPELRIYLR